MPEQKEKLRAIDLYSGVGGWSLGLHLAGIEVVASYEIWGPANETNFKNNAHQAQTVDIRRLALADLPKNIDIVVGSPPCTQFSFSNRGGGGNLADGLKDIIRFLTIVDHLKPRMWAMENVPRVAKIIDEGMLPGGVLAKFQHLGCATHLVDTSDYGIPQRRRRCIAGNFNVELLKTFKRIKSTPTLGDVVKALGAEKIIDPLYGLHLDRAELIDHVEEDFLSTEEVRINRANKTMHTVYNAMPFPDPMHKAVRTITATCTRVSRESVVIAVPEKARSYRRLTLRERACLQGFPITFQFYGTNYGQKLKMIGNAVPPAFSFLMGRVLQGLGADESPSLSEASRELVSPEPTPPETPPDRVGARYPSNRTFRFAIPSLRLKSGVRFELNNKCSAATAKWQISFYFGTSKSIRSIDLDEGAKVQLIRELDLGLKAAVTPVLEQLCDFVENTDIGNMQAVWAHKGPGGIRPFTFLDAIDEFSSSLIGVIEPHADKAAEIVASMVKLQYGSEASSLPGLGKLAKNATIILAGLLVGTAVNSLLQNHVERSRNQKLFIVG